MSWISYNQIGRNELSEEVCVKVKLQHRKNDKFSNSLHFQLIEKNNIPAIKKNKYYSEFYRKNLNDFNEEVNLID